MGKRRSEKVGRVWKIVHVVLGARESTSSVGLEESLEDRPCGIGCTCVYGFRRVCGGIGDETASTPMTKKVRQNLDLLEKFGFLTFFGTDRIFVDLARTGTILRLAPYFLGCINIASTTSIIVSSSTVTQFRSSLAVFPILIPFRGTTIGWTAIRAS